MPCTGPPDDGSDLRKARETIDDLTRRLCAVGGVLFRRRPDLPAFAPEDGRVLDDAMAWWDKHRAHDKAKYVRRRSDELKVVERRIRDIESLGGTPKPDVIAERDFAR